MVLFSFQKVGGFFFFFFYTNQTVQCTFDLLVMRPYNEIDSDSVLFRKRKTMCSIKGSAGTLWSVIWAENGFFLSFYFKLSSLEIFFLNCFLANLGEKK